MRIRLALAIALLGLGSAAPAHAGVGFDRFKSFTLKRGTTARRIELVRESGDAETALKLFSKMPEMRQAIKTMKLDVMRIANREEHRGGGALRKVVSTLHHRIVMTPSGGLRLRQNDVITEPGGGWDLWKSTNVNSDKKVRLGLIANNFRAVHESVSADAAHPALTPAYLADFAGYVLQLAASPPTTKP